MNIYTGGTFDLFHRGHVEFLEKCKRLAGDGQVVVALNTDEFIEEFKGKKPIMSFNERMAILLGSKYVDAVIKNIGEADSKVTIEKVNNDICKIDLVVIGSDWHDKDYLAQMSFTWQWLHEKKIGLCYIPRITPSSTTDIKERFQK
jgi:glycerol-3-phosphate cytidylyltransferase